MSAARALAFGIAWCALGSASCERTTPQGHEGHGGATAPATGTATIHAGAPAGHEGHLPPGSTDRMPDAAPGTPAGYAPITVDPGRARAIGLTTARVEERDFVRQLRTTGIVVVDETRTSHVHPKVRGWIDGIVVDYVGQRVKRGQVLCGIYSQEVHAAQIEYVSLLDRTGLEPLPRGEFAAQERSARDALLAAARRRLSLWDVPESEIERLEKTRAPKRTFPLLAPEPGVVVAKQVLEGMYVDPSVELYTLSDLSRVWLLADVYESDVGAVHLGQPAVLDVQGLAEPFQAKVAFVPPTIDEMTRTLKVRFEVANRERKLRPGAFASVSMQLALGRGLAVPESAVIRTGTRAIVFVVHENHVIPREVTLGPLVGNLYRVDAGLEAGQLVATGAQFLLDSESRLRATSGPGAGHAGH